MGGQRRREGEKGGEIGGGKVVRGGARTVTGQECVRKQERTVELLLLGWAVGGGGGRCLEEDKLRLNPPEGPRAPSTAATVTPDSINMELENIVANTVLLKAREGKDGDGGFDSFSLPYRHSSGTTTGGMPQTWVK